jgi:hypothetical protein
MNNKSLDLKRAADFSNQDRIIIITASYAYVQTPPRLSHHVHTFSQEYPGRFPVRSLNLDPPANQGPDDKHDD